MTRLDLDPVGVMYNSSVSVLLPHRVPSKINARLKAGTLKLEGFDNSGTEITPELMSPFMPRVLMQNVKTFAFRVARERLPD